MAPTSQSKQGVDTKPASSAYSFRNLLLLLPHVPLTSSSEIDYAAAEPGLLVQLADAADASLLIIHIGTSALGRLMARTASESFRNADDADAIEALGWLVAELNDLADAARRISSACRKSTFDFAPNADTPSPLARP